MTPRTAAPVEADARPLAEGLFTWPDETPHLVGSRCRSCGVTTFPAQSGCPRCSSEQMETVELPRTGPLWTFTTQGFPLKEPYLGPSDEDFEPFALGYVELGDVRVEGRLTESDPDRLRIGMTMEVTVEPFARDQDGRQLLMFAFAPSGGAGPEERG